MPTRASRIRRSQLARCLRAAAAIVMVAAPAGAPAGVIVRGLVIPSVSGDYVFKTSGSHAGDLWLSSNEDEGNRRLVLSGAGSTSTPIPLISASAYYFEYRGGNAALADVQVAGWAALDGSTSLAQDILPGKLTSIRAQSGPPKPTLVNISTRAYVSTGDSVLIPGFVVSGAEGSVKRVLIRSVGPRLADLGLPATDVLADPTLELVRLNAGGSNTVLATNDNWGDASNAAEITQTAAQVGAFTLDGRPTGTDDRTSSAMLLDLAPGLYTAVSRGRNDTTGVALVEVYDVSGDAVRLINVSNRGFVGLGNRVMIPGFVVGGRDSRTFLIRAVGPSLAAHGVPAATLLADPRLEVRGAGESAPLIAVNDNWQVPQNTPDTVAATAALVGAFSLEAGSTDAALVVVLPPGAYTVVCRGQGESTGVALVEVYEVPVQ